MNDEVLFIFILYLISKREILIVLICRTLLYSPYLRLVSVIQKQNLEKSRIRQCFFILVDIDCSKKADKTIKLFIKICFVAVPLLQNSLWIQINASNLDMISLTR